MPKNTTLRGSVAAEADAEAIRRLAAGAETLPEGPVLIAEVDGHPIAAIAIADGHSVSDPGLSTRALRTRLRLERQYVRLVHTLWGA